MQGIGKLGVPHITTAPSWRWRRRSHFGGYAGTFDLLVEVFCDGPAAVCRTV
jgi:hypothetical protein